MTLKENIALLSVGTGKTTLATFGKVSEMLIINNKIYFVASQQPLGNDAGLYVMNLDGSNQKKIMNIKNTMVYLSAYEETLYALSYAYLDSAVYTVDTKTDKVSTLASKFNKKGNFSSLQLIGKDAYFIYHPSTFDPYELWKVSEENATIKQIDSNFTGVQFMFVGDMYYYNNSDEQIYRKPFGTSGKGTKVTTKPVYPFFTIVDNFLYVELIEESSDTGTDNNGMLIPM